MAKYFVIGKDGQLKSKHIKIRNAYMNCYNWLGEKIQDEFGQVVYPKVA